MLIETYNQKGERVGETRVPSEIFGVEINPDLVHQVVVSQMANLRQSIAHTKDRKEVRGGGRKPWRQKGTGRARAGTIRYILLAPPPRCRTVIFPETFLPPVFFKGKSNLFSGSFLVNIFLAVFVMPILFI